MATHYETLGVGPTATDEEVRQAYLSRARRLHPDRTGGSSAREMQDVNEAWRVLRDRASRRAYDRSLLPPAPAVDPDDVPFTHPPADPGDIGVRVIRGLPWIIVAVVLAVIFVFTAFAGSDDGGPSGYDLAGECVESAGGDLEAVPCRRGVDEVVFVVSRQSQCTVGTSAVPAGDEWLCLRPFDE